MSDGRTEMGVEKMKQSTGPQLPLPRTPSRKQIEEERITGAGVVDGYSPADTSYYSSPGSPETRKTDQEQASSPISDARYRSAKRLNIKPSISRKPLLDLRFGNTSPSSLSTSKLLGTRRNPHRDCKKGADYMENGAGKPQEQATYEALLEHVQKVGKVTLKDIDKRLGSTTLEDTDKGCGSTTLEDNDKGCGSTNLEDIDKRCGSTVLVREKTRAGWLAREATRLCNEKANEQGWRNAIESEIFYKFDVDIDCKNCHNKLWKCEQEVPFSVGNDLSKLEQRRKGRKLCSCKLEDQPRGRCDMRTSPIFASVLDEYVYNGIERRRKHYDRRPDRIYGLRNIPKDSRQLNSDANVIGKVKSSPFQESLNHIHFPFLLVEAKSEKSSDKLGNIYKQSEGSIRRMLKLQADLISRVRLERDKRPILTGPLVWFFSFKGTQWGLHMCYTYDLYLQELSQGQERSWKIRSVDDDRYGSKEVWNGDITKEQDAAQLFELVDYLFDWARDIYRPSIIFYLKRLFEDKVVRDSAVPSLKDFKMPPKDSRGGIDMVQRPKFINRVKEGFSKVSRIRERLRDRATRS